MSYAAMAKERREDRKFRTPEGDYETLYKGYTHTLKTKNSGNEMIVLELKPTSAPTTEILEKLTVKKRLIKHKFVFAPNMPWSFPDFICFLEDLGVDLSQLPDEKDDMDHKGLCDVLEQLEKTPPTIKLKLSHQDKSEVYYNTNLLEVEKVFNSADNAGTDNVVAPVVVPPVVVLAPVVAPVTPAIPKEEEEEANIEGVTLKILIEGGWTMEQVQKDPKWSVLIPKVTPKVPLIPATPVVPPIIPATSKKQPPKSPFSPK